MDTILVFLAVVSPVIAGGLAIVVWRFYREESRRVDAQIAALTEMAHGPTDIEAPRVAGPAPVVANRTAIGAGNGSIVTSPTPPRPRVEPMLRSQTRASFDLPLHDSSPAVPATLASSTTLFRDAEEERASPWRTRAIVMGGLGLAAAAIVLFALAAHDSAAARVEPAPVSAAAAPAAASAPGLELLSLRDARQNGTLTITGLEQNPRSGAALTRVVVTAFAFDAKGSFLASGRAPLDYTTLQPGEESPFVVAVAVPESVARYRIGFRGEDGRVIAHVDRRQATTAVAENRP